MSNVIPLKSNQKLKSFGSSLWAWILFRFHLHTWMEESTATMAHVDDPKYILGQKYVQKCSHPHCGLRRVWKDYKL